MNRRGFLSSLAAATLAVALDVLPSFGDIEPEAIPADWTAMIVAQANLQMMGPWRTGVLSGFKDQFVPGTLRLNG